MVKPSGRREPMPTEIRRDEVCQMVAGGAGKPRYTELSVCWAPDEAEARHLAHARWPIAGMSGALLSDLRLPSHFAQAAGTITEEAIAQAVICGPNPTHYIAAI